MSIKQFPGGIITQNPTAPTTAAAKGIWTLGQAADFVKQGIWPRSPGTPTIGTATAGVASATVTYTAPTDLGAGTVTFTATSSPSGITGAGASPITVSGLANGTPYTFTVTAATPGGTSPASAASNSVTPVAPTVPGAPTIGTATATGATTATVVYTAPASNGGSVITSYTATSSPSGITGTLSQAGSGTITVSGLNSLTSYTFTVTATNAVGTSAASAASNSITTAFPAIGDPFGGGFYAGQISTAGNSVADYNLVIGPIATAQSTLSYKTSNSSTAGTSSDIDGPTNSSNMNNASHPAAQFCEGLTIGGFSDWYMAAKNELEVCYYNLKPTTTNNSTSSGINPNAVPARASNYTTGTPAQTSAAAFITSTGAQAFANQPYWSSTQMTGYSGNYARYQGFNIGNQSFGGKTNSYRVRAIRRVAV